jgi:hypothetical protein
MLTKEVCLNNYMPAIHIQSNLKTEKLGYCRTSSGVLPLWEFKNLSPRVIQLLHQSA